jgi:nucleoid-associated protein YgaU
MTISDLAYLEDISEGTTPTGGGYDYTIAPGDTLSEITDSFYADGTASCYKPVAKLNGIKNPNKIYSGDEIYLPDYVKGCGYLVV